MVAVWQSRGEPIVDAESDQIGAARAAAGRSNAKASGIVFE
jgi:hypothetical protein